MTGQFPNDPDSGSPWAQITQIRVAFTDHARMVGKPDAVLAPSALRLDTDPVVHGGSIALLAAKVSLGRLNRDVPWEELDLFQFAACCMTQPSTCPPKQLAVCQVGSLKPIIE
jgi:hypothetical protein